MNSKRRTGFFAVAALVVAFCVAGCQYFIENPYITVEESGLNWMDIHYYNLRKKPLYRVSVRIDGNGMIVVRSGTSMQITNQFAKYHEEENWNDIQVKRITIPPEDVVPLMQDLVDNDLFNRDRMGKAADTVNSNEFISVSAAINNKTYTGGEKNMFDIDPDLAERLRNLVLMFHSPTPKRRK